MELVDHTSMRSQIISNATDTRRPAPFDTFEPPRISAASFSWFRTHRGAKEPTLRQYARGATDLLRTLGEDVSQWSARALRDFLLERASQCRKQTTKSLIPALRAFLRFLNFRGEFRDEPRPRDRPKDVLI